MARVPPHAYFDQVVAETGAMLARVALSVVRDRHLAKDACQQAYLAFHVALCRGTAIANPAGWLRRVVLRKAYALGRRGAVSLDALGGDAPDPASVATAPEQAEALGAALARLPADQREALRLKVVEGVTYRDVADALGCSVPTAWRRVRAGLAALARALGRSPAHDRSIRTPVS